jgi:cytochrome c peroxidase
MVKPALAFSLALSVVACGSADLDREEAKPATRGHALTLAVPSNAPPSLKTVAVPRPPNLADFVRDEAAAIRLGKALFWDMQVGSDGKTACATCHFHAGADSRAKNQVNPGSFAGDESFALGPNRRLTLADFPLHQLSNPDDRNSTVLRDTNDVVSSAGVFNSTFVALVPGSSADLVLTTPDQDGFRIGLTNTRRVEPRNTPSVINAVFNHRNFWDGRAQAEFNGVDVWGDRNPNAFVYERTADGHLAKARVRIPNASLASQAVGPPLSAFEMSADGRTFEVVGDKLVSSFSVSTSVKLLRDTAKKLLARRPLAGQRIAADDSVLVPLESTYAELVEKAFQPRWWQSNSVIAIDSNGERKLVRSLLGIKLDPLKLSVDEYSQMQYNFALFFGLAIQLYEATLVADDSPYDRMREGGASISDEALHGLTLFSDTVRVRCINCHGGAEMTFASVSKISKNRIRRREGNILDFGYNNIGLRPTNEDLALGGVDPWGKPLSETRMGVFDPSLSPPVSASDVIGVDGAFKAPGLRNVELTAPFFHNGGAATLMQVIELYSRGGDFQPIVGRDGPISPLNTPNLTAQEKQALVAFLQTLTDERVRFERAPFDHPELLVPDGHPGDEHSVTNRGDGNATDAFITVPAVGRNGRAAPPSGFLAP